MKNRSSQQSTSSIAALDGTEPRARATDPTTSVDAARKINTSKKHQLHVQLYYYVYSCGERGVIQHDAEQRFENGATPQRIRSSFSELEALGLLYRSDRRSLTPSGRWAQVWLAELLLDSVQLDYLEQGLPS